MTALRTLLILTAFLAAPVAADPLRILCVGDSITQGGMAGRPEYTYRLPLQRMLTGIGVTFDFVGTRREGLTPFQWPAGFDPDHEGYYGAKTRYAVERAVAGLGQYPAPDVALILLGATDGEWDYGVNVVQPIEALIAALRARNPRVVVLVGEPNGGLLRRWAKRLRMEGMAARLTQPQSPVAFVHLPAKWDGVRDTFDGAHPNEAGQLKLAAAWLGAMAPYLETMR
jgi:acyl-CoA thioesterase-1